MSQIKNRRMLLNIALILSMVIVGSSISVANAAPFAKIQDIKGDTKSHNTSDPHKEWIPILAVVKGKRLVLKDRKGRTKTAKNGTYRLRGGAVVKVRNGLIIHHRKGTNASMNTNSPKKLNSKEPAYGMNQNKPQKGRLKASDLKMKAPVK